MREYLKSFKILSENEIEQAIENTTPRKLKKGEYFIHEGEICRKVGFICSGIFRSYYLSNGGEEITYCMNFPNNFITAYSSFINGKPSPEYMQAITPAELLVIPKTVIDTLAEESKNWLKFLKTNAEQQYITLEKRIFQFQKENAKQRYIDLLTNEPEYIQNIPLHYLASYLGITQRHLSRLRKEISF